MNQDKMHLVNKLFNNETIRTVWDNEQEKYFISVVDIVRILTDSDNPQVYWRVMKKRLKDEGNETVTNCNALKLKAQDGKYRMTDIEVALSDLGEIATRELAKKKNPKGLEENKIIARKGGNVSKVARNKLEYELNESVVSKDNHLNYSYNDNKKIENK